MLILLASVGAMLNVAKTIVGIGGLIFVHELGHFLVGRWCGVHAEAFSIGFGPVLLKWQGRAKHADRPEQRTQYRLSAIPLGGYVKFLGENPDERGDLDPRSLHAATYPRKVAIMLAGVTMNVLAAFVLFAATYVIGWETNAPVAGSVMPGSPAWEAGVRPGDEFVTIDGRRVLDFSDVRHETLFANEVDVVLRRGGRELEPMRIRTRDAGDGIRQIGVGPAIVPDGRIGVDDGGAASAAGFATGDRVVAVDGGPVRDFDEAEQVHSAAKRATNWTVERAGERVDVTLPWATVPHAKIGVVLAPDSDELLVQRGGAAATAGLASGDRLVSVGGKPSTSVFRLLHALGDAGTTGPLVVRRGDREIEIPLPDAAHRAEFAASIASVGPVHASFGDGPSRAKDAGLPDGCEVVEADGKPVATSADVQVAVKRAFDEHRVVTLRWRDADGRDGTTDVTPADEPDADFGGMGPLALMATVHETNPISAASLAFDRTGRWIGRILATLKSVVTGRLSGSKLAGPIQIATGTYHSAKSSWGDFLIFLGMISMNLAVINVLPLPILDGGQLLMQTIEHVRGRPIPERVLEGVQWSGLVLLLALMVYVIRNDILTMLSS